MWKFITLFWEIFLFIPIYFFYIYVWYNLQLVLYFIICWIIVDFIGCCIKYFFFKPRPEPMKYKNWIQKVKAWSFPSLHSARTFLLFLFSITFTNIYISSIYFLFWLTIAYSRIKLKKHFPVDIIWWVVLSIIVFLVFFKFLQFLT